MPDRCLIVSYSSKNSPAQTAENISVHKIPYFGDERPIAKHRRKLWVNFVQAKRPKWVPTKHSVICSKHFNDADFQYPIRSIAAVPKKEKHMLKRDEIGVTVVPSINLPDQPTEEGINETGED
eukprot:gene20725-22758_t